MSKKDRAVAIDYIRILVDYMSGIKGLDVSRALEKAKIPRSWLEQKSAYLNQSQYVILVSELLAKQDRQKTVIDLLKGQEITHHGLLGLLAMCSISFKSGMNAFLRFYHIQMKLIHINYIEEPDEAVVIVSTVGNLGDADKFTIELALLSMQKAKRQLLGYVQHDDTICLDYHLSKPELYLLEFSLNDIKLNQPHCELRFPLSHIDMKVRSGHKQSFDLLYKQCENLLIQLKDEPNIVLKTQAIIENITDDFPKLDDVAQLLSMSTRTLTRKLKEHGTNFQTLLENEKMKRAKQLLTATQITITDIALGLSYADSSHFTKSFTKAVGMSPTAYRTEYQL